MRTRVKICGITDRAQAAAVCDAGADALGLVFYAGSPRAVSLAAAAQISEAVAPLVTVVALFVDPPAELVRDVLSACAVDQLQFHGDEDAEFCEQFERPYIKALRMRPELDLAAATRAHPRARSLLFDSYRPGVPGGTGESFDWSRLPAVKRPWMLAGGLGPENVGAAIATLRPPAVDVSGGVESAPGIKDPGLLRRFLRAVTEADEQLEKDAA